MLRIPLGASPLGAAVLLLMHGVAAACVAALAPGWPWMAPVLLALAASLIICLRRDAFLLAGNAVIELGVRDDGSCELVTRAKGSLHGQVLDSTFASGVLITVNVRLDSGRLRSVSLLPDSASAENRRALRVWLRHALRPETTGSAGP